MSVCAFLQQALAGKQAVGAEVVVDFADTPKVILAERISTS